MHVGPKSVAIADCVSPGATPAASTWLASRHNPPDGVPGDPPLPFVLPRPLVQGPKVKWSGDRWLTVANQRRRARNATEMARLANTTAARTWQRWHQLA